LFEAGAISNNVEFLSTQDGKEIGKPSVCTYLFDVKPTDVQKPLEMFQWTIAKDRDDNRKLLDTINTALGKEGMDNQKLDRVFDTYWPELHEKLKTIPNVVLPLTLPPPRSTDEIMLDVLTEVRSLSKLVESNNMLSWGSLQQITPLSQLVGDPSVYVIPTKTVKKPKDAKGETDMSPGIQGGY
jgi:hypothetical protein